MESKKKRNTKKNHEDNKIIHEENKKMHYFSYQQRIFLYLILFTIFFVLTIIIFPKSFKFTDIKLVKYQENSNLDYKVYLKENDFYETDYLEKDKIYIASLIDKIKIDFNYDFFIDKSTNIDYNYEIVARLLIEDESSKSTYFEKEYTLLENVKKEMINSNSYNLKEQIVIDYDYYNSLANKFKAAYGINANSSLNVYLKIKNINDEESNLKIDIDSLMLIRIPLSQKSINIEMSYNNIDVESQVLEEEDISISSTLYIIISIITLLITLITFIKLIRLLSLLKVKKSNYDKFVKRILNEYDRLIVENYSGPNLEKSNIIKIKKIEELLDVRDNLKLPIMYYTVTKHQKCYFYIKHNDDLYLMVIKSTDLEKNVVKE